MNDWLLPQNIQDILPPESHVLEKWRRSLLDLYMSYGYQLVIPPMQEFQNSLAMAGRDLDTRMYKVVDRKSGKTIGLRPDITPQVARIDAHIYQGKGISRLCYCDRVLHSYPVHQFASREPINIGAEIYGIADLTADAESLILLNNSFKTLNIVNHNLEIHHMGLIREILVYINQKKKQPISEEDWLATLKIKSKKQIKLLLKECSINLQKKVLALLDLYGDENVIAQAKKILPKTKKINQYLQDLTKIFKLCKAEDANMNLTIDLADARGYKYHSGLMFAVYAPNWANALAYGGRYDGFGDRFGVNLKNRSAVGFTIDLFEAQLYASYQNSKDKNGSIIPKIFADQKIWQNKQGQKYICQLRVQGKAVIVGEAANSKNNEKANNCNYIIIKSKNKYILKKI